MGRASRDKAGRRRAAAGARTAGSRTGGAPTSDARGGALDDHVDRVLDAAVAHAAAGRGWQVEATLVALAGGAAGPGEESHLAGRQLVLPRRLVARLHGELPRLYAEGWQPADLLRVARRRLGERPATLLAGALVSQLATYPPDSVDPRWSDQLLDPRGRAPRPAPDLLPAVAARWPGGWTTVATAAVQLEALLGRLAPVAVIGPLPGARRVTPPAAAGAAGSATGADAHRGVDERVLGRVRAMLAKAESTPYPAEAETFTAAAQSLMARHSIDAALLAAASGAAGGHREGSSAGPASVRIGIDEPYEGAKTLLLDVVARANRCSAVWSTWHGSSTVVGFPADLLAVELLFTSLLVQATARLTALGAATGAGARVRSTGFRRSYLVAYALRIGERLRESTEDQTQQAVVSSGAGAALLPVLASRADAVERELRRIAPRTVSATTSAGSDPAGWASGRAAADLASLRAGAALPAAG